MVRHTEADDESTDVKLSDLPDELEDDDAVDYFWFVDVPGTLLTVQFDADADAFDVSRVVSTVDRYGYEVEVLHAPGDEYVIGQFDR